MQEIVVTLVFMMALLMFAAFPAYKIVEWLKSKRCISYKMQNFLTLVLTIVLALLAALFLKLA